MAAERPECNQDYCEQCGEKTTTECQNYKAKIRGYYHVPGVLAFSEYKRSAYCYNCGKPYLWTTARLNAAAELADELEELSSAEKEKLKKSIPELTKDGPATQVAEARFKKIMKKVGAEPMKRCGPFQETNR